MATEGGDHVVDLVGRLLDVVEEASARILL